jgi:hypothetical protein
MLRATEGGYGPPIVIDHLHALIRAEVQRLRVLDGEHLGVESLVLRLERRAVLQPAYAEGTIDAHPESLLDRNPGGCRSRIPHVE